jgi:hypothetical protein
MTSDRLLHQAALSRPSKYRPRAQSSHRSSTTGKEEDPLDDAQIHGSIDRMVAEEHQLWEREAAGDATDADRQRLESLRVSLDQCWDLLRQRRARREAGQSPEGADIRPPEVVERYEQ